jgi:alpha-tubulin suppressor-like RCC1 family protein
VHGGASACHFVVRALDGAAYVFGRNTAGALGTGTGASKAKKFKTKEDTPASDDSISEHAPRRITASSLPGGRAGQKIIHAACGRSHTLLVGSGGQVWASGSNNVGQVRMTWVVIVHAFMFSGLLVRCTPMSGDKWMDEDPRPVG